MDWNIVRDFLICVPATAFFAILFRVPRRAVAASAVIGAAGYALYELVYPPLHSAIAGYFLGTLLIAISAEILARIMRMPATIFVIPGIIPLVPGLGLYETMAYLVQGKDSLAGRMGVTTLFEIAAMAMALVVTSLFTAALTSALRRRGRSSKRHPC